LKGSFITVTERATYAPEVVSESLTGLPQSP